VRAAGRPAPFCHPQAQVAAEMDEAVDAEAATEHTRNQRGTYEGNATI